MAEYVLTATKNNARAGSFYDRIEGFYDLTFKLNGYGRSLDQYFEAHHLPVFPGASVLDAGCGTGTLTLALLRNLKVPVKLTALDLSTSSMATAKKYVGKNNPSEQAVRFAQGNVLALPFADEAFDLVLTSGVLEYVHDLPGIAAWLASQVRICIFSYSCLEPSGKFLGSIRAAARRFSSRSRSMSNSKWGTHDQTHSRGRGSGGQ